VIMHSATELWISAAKALRGRPSRPQRGVRGA
jgi:hypothetical protein